MRVKMVLKDMGARENGAKVCIALKYSFACPRTKLQRRCL
jgi:hypothetical protein